MKVERHFCVHSFIYIASLHRIPLHYALEAGKTWESGISSLVDANPKTLLIADFRSQFYPFLISATVSDAKLFGRKLVGEKMNNKHQIWNNVSNTSKESIMNEEVAMDFLSSLSTVYQMIRQEPSALTKVLAKADDDGDDELILLRNMNKHLMDEKKTLR